MKFATGNASPLIAICREKIISVCIPIILGNLSGMSGRQGVSSDWYKALKKPLGVPPNQMFPIVWMGLYACMGWAAHLVAQMHDSTVSPSKKSKLYQGFLLYWLQLGLNLAWTPLFFRKRKTFAALVCNILLTGAVFSMTNIWDKATNHKTTYLLAPYCAWVLYATYLTGGLWWLNNRRAAVPSQVQTSKEPSSKKQT